MQDQAILHEELKCLRGILNTSLFHCSYFIKELPNGFPSRIACSAHLGCCSPTARVFLRFPKFSQHPACMDHAILHGKPFGIPLSVNSESGTLWLKISFDLYVSETLLYCARFYNALYVQFTLSINYIYYSSQKPKQN